MFYSFQVQENWTASMDAKGLHILFTKSEEWIGTHRYVQTVFTLLKYNKLVSYVSD